MKKLKVLIVFLLLSSIAFSQKDTVNNTKSFSIPVVKKIMKDVLRGDSAKAQLDLANLELNELQKKIILKDTIIFNLREKESNYLSIIDKEKEKYDLMKEYTDDLKKDYKKLKRNSTLKSVFSGALTVLLTYFLISK